MKRVLATILTVVCAVTIAWPAGARAETYSAAAVGSGESGQPAALKGETEIEKLTDAWHAAQSELGDAQAKAVEIQGEIDAIEEELPVQEARGAVAARRLYIMQNDPLALVEPFLSMESLGEALKYADSLELLSEKSSRALDELHASKERLEAARQEQAAVVEEAQGRADEAQAALAQVQDARAVAQVAAQKDAAEQAEKSGGKIAPRQSDIDAKKKRDAEKKPEGAKDEQKGSEPEIDFDLPVTASDEPVVLTKETAALADGVDWHADRDEFIAEWSARIDAYLAGSPLEGQGANFAASAWKHGIDPRWSPAISNTESSKGAFCIRPHNAWGWGAADSDPYGLASEWESWEEAIDAHVAGLADGYGYTISMAKAQKYCSSWSSWYNNTLAQMARI